MHFKVGQAFLILAFICTEAMAAEDPIRIGLIEALSGPMAVQGEYVSHHLHAAVDELNAAGGVLGGRKFEAVDFDSKLSPHEGLIALKNGLDKGIVYYTQGLGSSVGIAISEAIAKHNARNPQRPALFLNYGALDPALTNEKCHFWHFRFDPNTDMRVAALTAYLAGQPRIKKVYLFNQDYAWGHSVSRAARAMITARRPDIEIVGDDLHPLAKIKDFAPYVTKINASGADAVVTGNWGTDLTLLIKASEESGLRAQFYLLGTGLKGVPTAIGKAGENRLRIVMPFVRDAADLRHPAFADAFKKNYGEDWSFQSVRSIVRMLAAAMEKAKSADPLPVARALEGMRMQGDNGEMWMRAEDHQLFVPLYVATLARAGSKGVVHDWENTGFGFRADARIEARDFTLPTTCRMSRP
jgi:branched-chain amino acid transport system substrate-binding protein